MTEDQARRVVLLMSREAARAAHWSDADRDWATRQALAAAGERAEPDTFAATRAALALPRLLPRDEAAQRWLARRLWHPAWLGLALLLGWLAGVVVDQLGAPQRVNLLAPAVWAVVAWNAAVYAGLLLPGPGSRGPGWHERIGRWSESRGDALGATWARHAGPLAQQRVALLLHAAAAALALGLISGLYLRGLVLDYRAGWQSTFLDAATVQALLGVLLAPAAALSGVAVPAVAPLQLAPGAAATASAAPWIHLFAATLLLAVVLPRLAFAAVAAARARHLARHFPLPLDTPYFRSLHPLMRPGAPRPLRLLWVPLAGPVRCRLFDADVGDLKEPQTLWATADGEQLLLEPTPPALLHGTPAPARPWWRPWAPADPAEEALKTLAPRIDAVALLLPPGRERPAWLAALGRPLLVFEDTARATPPALALHDLSDGWLRCGALLQALQSALPDDTRLQGLAQAWRDREAQRLQSAMQLVAASLARVSAMRQPVPESRLFGARADAEPARAALTLALDAELRDTAGQLARHHGITTAVPLSPQAGATTLREKLGEGRAALLGGVLTGVVTGLKADIATGGLTMGAGAVAGGVIGAASAYGAARGLNSARGTDESHATWSDDTLARVAQTLLQHHLQLSQGLPPEDAAARLQRALPAQQGALGAVWQARAKGLPPAGQAERMAQALQPLLVATVQQALGGPTAAAQPRAYTAAP